ncbi:MAG TPA: hypothetical protein VMN57_05125 [Anaerolineales bacterium]|nr:hypothetical protein [Anaerolineales bacterium]
MDHKLNCSRKTNPDRCEALVEAQLVLATLLQQVRQVKMPGYTVEPDPVFTLRVKGGLPMRVLSR